MRSPINIRTLRDMARRDSFANTELLRRAYLYLARNEGLPMKLRAQAQLSLNNLPTDSHPTKIHERCIITGKGRGVIAKLGLCRHQLKLKASKDKWMGFEKAVW
ncbi:hypothetical protein MJO28_009739 [Puccinia striiformis f. sp. tritici]|uniref:Uncharacterized protein n=3 Tax=Puccinia striiformis TaxID=27350 RepID=A0A0L0V8S0_9BASI|nr:hypothetical protein Pst134EA_017402 [Puccinia striiformis f. sp. tritici]KAI9607400.1 hypothetical protein H4Q26_005920 [Puccinia striiformis f. sp. tritici PST-130]KNE95384.1 hypothetical protein PSTG_11237 [Puccinia striiformis f. sp. tritici PST-78]POW10575.1 hypothetical protein PSTT_05931 [Puccinia striiformis]KAH9450806.1 hypothetical protein Pst134EB_018317 [Puccinia striiformis f. sp. tritici]KAH9461093.1 hypothetical protein Pst134EA_017402 [Puccinia striiformis f. sp. tritici]